MAPPARREEIDCLSEQVWIYRQQLHLIPLDFKSALPFEQTSSTDPSFEPEEEGFLDCTTAIALVRDPSADTLAPADLQQIVWARIDRSDPVVYLSTSLALNYLACSYPAKITSHHHKTLAYLPVEIALALSDSPGLAAEAIGAFYEREPSTLRVRFQPVRAFPILLTLRCPSIGLQHDDPLSTLSALQSLLRRTL